MKVYGRVTSSNVMKVLWALDEIGVPYERVDAGMTFGVVDTPEYRAMNPNGRVPTIVDGDLVLWESNAIVRYIGAKYDAGGIWPEDPAKRADLDRWMDWQQTTVNAPFTPVFWQLVRTPPEQRDQAAIDAGVTQSVANMRILEARIDGCDWLAGDRLTMADIPFGPILHRFFNLPFERPDLPKVRGWYDRMCARPAFKRHIVDVPIS